jgi:hypothetical protein
MVSLLQQITLIQQYGNVLDRGGRGTGEHEKIAWLIEEKIRMGHWFQRRSSRWGSGVNLLEKGHEYHKEKWHHNHRATEETIRVYAKGVATDAFPTHFAAPAQRCVSEVVAQKALFCCRHHRGKIKKEAQLSSQICFT